ncbi:MAG: YbaK/EbsC family protein [Chloroflexota bacterium]
MNAGKTLDRPYKPLLDWLAGQDIEYEIREHDLAFTARTTATAEGVDPRTFAKVVAVAPHDGPNAFVVLDATDHLDLRKARHVLGAGEVRLLSEPELTALAPGCEVGAIPAVGAMFGLATYADYAVRDDPEVSFNAGSHRFSARVDRARWERACGIIYADLAEDADAGPVWARS